MAEFTPAPRQSIIKTIKRLNIHTLAESITTTPEIIGGTERTLDIPRIGSITPMEFDVSFGASDIPPSSALMEWFLALVEIDNLPDILTLRDRAIWSRIQRWKDFGTPANKMMMTSYDQMEFWNPPTFSNFDVNGFSRRIALAAIGRFSSTFSGDFVAVLTYLETIIQRRWGTDNATYGDDPDALVDGLMMEESGLM